MMRLLPDIIENCRLAQGHARLMLRKQVLVIDALVVVSLMESCITEPHKVNLLGEGVLNLSCDFSNNPQLEYETHGRYQVLKICFQ